MAFVYKNIDKLRSFNRFRYSIWYDDYNEPVFYDTGKVFLVANSFLNKTFIFLFLYKLKNKNYLRG